MMNLRNKELVRMIISRAITFVGHVARMGKINSGWKAVRKDILGDLGAEGRTLLKSVL
jgi:hypothetical protein